VQYASIAYRQRLADRDITISMSRLGNPFDNAKAESLMKTLKTEINGKAFADLSDARRRIDSFIANVYNSDRLHSALGYRSPLEFETAFRAKQSTITHHGNRTVTEIIVSHSRGAVQHPNRGNGVVLLVLNCRFYIRTSAGAEAVRRRSKARPFNATVQF
jgi:hypothetical protein